jgi:hypothetical protein
MKRTTTWCETLSLQEASQRHTTSLSPEQLKSRPLAVWSYGDCLLKLFYRIIDIDFLPIETLLQGHKGIRSHEEIWMSVQEKDDLARQSLLMRSSKWLIFFVNKTNRCTELQFYWCYDSTCFGQTFCPSSEVLSRTSALVQFMQLGDRVQPGAGWNW